MKKIVVIAVLVLVAAAAGAFFVLKSKADKDVQEITTAKKSDLSAKMEAVKDAGLEELKKQLAAESAAVRLAAAGQLIELDKQGKEGVAALLEQLSSDDKQDKDLRNKVQRHLAEKALAGKQGQEKLEEAKKLLADPRAGFRLAGLNALAEDKSPETLELLKKIAAEEKDEDVQLTAEMIVEKLTGGGGEGQE
jgi:HEAT repeat protein